MSACCVDAHHGMEGLRVRVRVCVGGCDTLPPSRSTARVWRLGVG